MSILKDKLKRFAAVVLSVAVTAVSLAGCAQNGNDSEDKSFRRGYWVGSVFVSRYTGVLFEMPKEWSRYSESDFDELAAKMNLGEGITFDMASMSAAGSSIMLFAEDLTKIENGTSMTEEEYLNSIGENLKKSTEYTYTPGEMKKLGFVDNEYMRLEVKVSDDSFEKVQWYLARRIDDNMVVFVFTGKDAEEINSMAQYFTKYSEEVNQEGFGEEESQNSEQEEETMLKKGGWKDENGVQVYENESMGIKFVNNSEWTVLSEEELNALSGNDGNGEKLTIADGYENASAFEFGVKTKNGSSIVMLAEDLGLDDLTKNINERGYIEMIEQNLSQTDLKYKFGDAEEVKVSSGDFLKLPCEMADGQAQQWYFVDKVDVFMITIIVTASSDNAAEMDEFMSAFSEIGDAAAE